MGSNYISDCYRIRHKSSGLFSVALVVIVGILIYALFLTDWVHEAKPTFVEVTRINIGCSVICGIAAACGWWEWPKPHRHTLSQKEREEFEKPLKNYRQPEMSVTSSAVVEQEPKPKT
jgi:hypothetical protein